ncbi:MAG: hypothetical protein K8R45_01530, partial [Desulfobacterales bacterium]|nr:hypothetical protein [Desulfobacterales bacterium]
METNAVAKFVRISPRKIRLVMDQVRGKRVDEALNMLSFAPQKGALILKKLIDSAVQEEHMDKPIENYWKIRLEALKKSLEENNFEVFLVNNSSEAKAIVQKEILPKTGAKSV